MRKRLLSNAPPNVFQRSKAKRAEAEKAGKKIINLTVGQPSGPAILEARMAAAAAVMSDKESMHEYQDNGSPGVPDFSRRFIQCHVVSDLKDYSPDTVSYLPIPGIKPMLQVLVESLGTWERPGSLSRVFTMTDPGYPTPGYVCGAIKGIQQVDLPLNPKNGFLFSPDDLTSVAEGDLICLNFPENPTGIIARRDWLTDLCRFCSDRGVRLFNDGAYHILSNTPDSVTLTDIALGFRDLNWIEAFSASKAGNFTGWRVGAMAGSPEFISDVAQIKGNLDSGFVAFAAAGVLDVFENHRDRIEEVHQVYAERLELVASVLGRQGMRLAVKPEAGFFLLFDAPSKAFGLEVADGEHFNNIMTDNTGISGIPFGKWIRYAICATDVGAQIEEIEAGFAAAAVSYKD
jgi:LL-diaminopimelate aminotransferase